MKILLAYPPGAVLAGGGLWTQVTRTAEALSMLGVDVVRFESLERHQLHEYDLCHIIGAHLGTYHLARELYRKGVPMVVSPVFFSRHSFAFLRAALFLQSGLSKIAPGLWIDYRFTADICSWAQAVVPNTHAEAELLSNGLGVSREKISVVPNGVDERFYYATPDEFVRKYGRERFVLNVGYLGAERKNTVRLIRVLNRLDVDAVVIGEGQDQDYLEACRREAAKNKRLLLIEGLPHDSLLLTSAYAACEVFVLPSLYETPGIAALEAALAGAKIVITRYGGTREYFRDWAEYVEPTSDESIGAGIRAALEKPSTNALRDHIRQNYLWSEVGKRTREVYEKVIR